MPFTLVHPAAVLPVARSPLVPSALACGAMAPDLPYYVSLQWIGGDYNLTLTHAWTSALWLDPLIGLVLLAIFQVVLRRPLVALMPGALAGRLSAVGAFRWRRVGWIALSLVLGALTHLGWDALSDAFGYGWSTRLNLAGDVLGGAVLLGFLWFWWHRAPMVEAPEPVRRRGAAIAAVVLVALAWGVWRGYVVAGQVDADLRQYGDWSRRAVLEYAVREFAVQAGTAAVAALAVYAAAWHVRRD